MKIINALVLIAGVGLIGLSVRDNWSDKVHDFVSPSPNNLTCPQHLPHGVPSGTPPSNDFICRDSYAISSNDATKFADFVAYRLDRATITGSDEQERKWQADPVIKPRETLEPEDYIGAYKALGTDRGHLAPLASFRGGNWQETNYLSNIVPQKSDLNRTTWLELEKYVRDLVREHGEVYVITGTAYHKLIFKLPSADEPHKVPSAFWKVVMYNGKLESYIYEQETPKGADFKLGETALSEIEGFSGLDLGFLLEHYQQKEFPGL